MPLGLQGDGGRGARVEIGSLTQQDEDAKQLGWDSLLCVEQAGRIPAAVEHNRTRGQAELGVRYQDSKKVQISVVVCLHTYIHKDMVRTYMPAYV